MPLQSTYGAASIRGFGRVKRPGDPYFPNVTLLLHCEGADFGTSFTDSSPVGGTLVASGAAFTLAVAKKFDAAGFRNRADANGLLFSNAGRFAFGTGNFTVECWYYYDPVQLPSVQGAFLATNPSRAFSAQFGTSIANLAFYGAAGPTDTTGWAHGMVSGWYHLAWVRNGNTRTIYVNGVSIGSAADLSGVDFSASAGSAVLGINVASLGNPCISGYMDEMRVTNGAARYTANFTPPSAAFPGS